MPAFFLAFFHGGRRARQTRILPHIIHTTINYKQTHDTRLPEIQKAFGIWTSPSILNHPTQRLLYKRSLPWSCNKCVKASHDNENLLDDPLVAYDECILILRTGR